MLESYKVHNILFYISLFSLELIVYFSRYIIKIVGV